MPIADLQPRQGKVEIEAEVIDKGEIREFEKFGKTGRVCNAKIKDGSGEVALTLWNDDIDKISVGDKIKITNGYVNEWQGEKQLTTGKFGKLEVLESSGIAKNKETDPTPTKDEEELSEEPIKEEETIE